MLDDLEGKGVIREGFREQLLVANSLEEVKQLLSKFTSNAEH